ncbi:MAG: MFS transporter [Anaerolineales bacterium]|nr:MFS transporter [Anaerolineales bacterium]
MGSKATRGTSLLSDEQRHNYKHLYADTFWWGVLAGSTISFASVFASRAGASGIHLGLLSAGPALINLLLSIPSGRWLESRSPLRVTYLTAILNRAGYLPFVLLPLIASQALQVWGLIAITLLMTLPAVALGIAFNASFADIVPPEQRAHVVGRRNALVALSLTLSALLSGQILDLLPYPSNYVLVFGMGFLGAALSTYHLGRLRAGLEKQRRVGKPILDMARPGVVRMFQTGLGSTQLRFLARPSRGLRLELLHGPFGKFMLAYLLFYTCQYIPLPLFPIFFVNELGLSDGLISFGTAIFHGAMMLVSVFLERFSNRWGHRGLVLFAAAGYSIYPLMNGLTSQVWVYLLASLLGGALWGLLGASLINLLMERVPADARPSHMALHNLVLNLGILAGSFSGPLISAWLGLRPTLLIGAAARLLAAVLMIFWTRPAETTPAARPEVG